MRILLAEDDEKLNETLVYGLTQAGFVVDACFDGEDALFYGVHENPIFKIPVPAIPSAPLRLRRPACSPP